MQAFAFFGGLALAVTSALVLALKALSAERRAGDWHAQATGAEAGKTALASQLADMINRFNEEKARADSIEDALMARAAGTVDGSHGELLQAIAAARAARRDGSGIVPASDSAPPSRRGDSRLLDPGEDP